MKGSALPWVIGAGVIVAVLIAAAFLIGTTSDGPGEGDWLAFTDPDTGISVDLPGAPESERLTVSAPSGGAIDAVFHGLESRRQGWFFGVYLLDGEAFNLSYSLLGATGAIAGELISSNPGTVDGMRVLDGEVHFEDGGREGVTLIRLVAVESSDAVVMLQSIGLRSEHARVQESFDRMIGSLVP